MSQTNNGYSYMIRIQIDITQIQMIVRNAKCVPTRILEQMARTRIEREISDMYQTQKYYRTQTHEQFYSKTIKKSDFVIEDLNEVEVYDLGIEFDKNENIINKIDDKHETKTIESRINTIKDEFKLNV